MPTAVAFTARAPARGARGRARRAGGGSVRMRARTRAPGRRAARASAAAMPARIRSSAPRTAPVPRSSSRSPTAAQVPLERGTQSSLRGRSATRPGRCTGPGRRPSRAAARYVTASTNVGPSPRARAADTLADGPYTASTSVTVDADGRHPVPDRLVGQASRLPSAPRAVVEIAHWLLLQTRTSGAFDHRRDVRALVERALGRGPVAEEHARQPCPPLEPKPPGEPRRVRHLGGDRHADRRDTISAGFHQPDGWPRHHDSMVAAGSPRSSPIGRLPVAREDPVALLERVHDARLDRLVTPEDRVRADAALAVVDDRPLVVGAQQDERAMEREERRRRDPHTAVGLAVDADDATQPLARRAGLGLRTSEVKQRCSFQSNVCADAERPAYDGVKYRFLSSRRVDHVACKTVARTNPRLEHVGSPCGRVGAKLVQLCP